MCRKPLKEINGVALFLQLEYLWNMELISLNCIGEVLVELFLLFLHFYSSFHIQIFKFSNFHMNF
jgi:hypothetical protein